MKWIRNLLPHLCLMLGGVLMTFFILDIYNPARAFLEREPTRVLLVLFLLAAAAVSVLLARSNRREE